MFNYKSIEVKLKLMICLYKLDLLNTLNKLLIKLSKHLQEKFILNLFIKKLLLIIPKELNFKNLLLFMKLNNLSAENLLFKKELELKLLLDLVKKLLIILIFNLLYKEKMLMLISIDKLININN